MTRILFLGTGPAPMPAFETPEITVRAPSLPDVSTPATWPLADLAVLAAGQEGTFDAVVVGGGGDFGVLALRSVLDVPVLGAGRTAMSYALTLGADFSVAAAPGLAHRMGKLVSEAGLAGHCAGVSGTGDFETDTVIDAGGTPPSGRALLHADRVAVEMVLAFLALGLAHSKRATPTPGVLQADLVTRLAGDRPRP